MNCSKLLLVILLFNVSTLVLSCAQNPLNGDHPCPGVLEKLMDIVTAGDDPDAISQLMKGYPVGFSQKLYPIIKAMKAMIRLDRHESFRFLFGLLVKTETLTCPRSDEIKINLSSLLWDALSIHRPKICKFLMSTYPARLRLADFKGNRRRFWIEEASALWTLEELLDVAPPDGCHSYPIRAPKSVFRECNTLESCLLPLEFNLLHIPSTKEGMKTCTRMLEALLLNESLGDEDMAAVIHRFVGRVKVKDGAIKEFYRARPNYPLSRHALIAVLPDGVYKGYPDYVLKNLCKLSYEHFERLKQIVTEDDNPQAMGNILGYSLFALAKRIFKLLRLMLELDRVASFKLLFSMVDFANLSEKVALDAISTLIYASHAFKKVKLFEYLVVSEQFIPSQFVNGAVTSAPFEYSRESDLNDFIDCIEHMASINDKILGGGILLSNLALKVVRNCSLKVVFGGLGDNGTAVLLGRLCDLGAVFEQEAVDALEQHHPDYVMTRKFILEHLQDVKEPADYN